MIRLLFVLVFASSVSVCAHGSEQLLYLASLEGKTIVAKSIVKQTGELITEFSINLPANPGPMAFSPDKSYIYAAVTGLPDNKAGVVTLSREKNGSLTVKHTATIRSRAPYIQVSRDGAVLLAAHYGAGDVTTYRINEGTCTGKLLDHKVTFQTAHCIELDPSGRYAYVPHTKPNRVYQFLLNTKDGTLTPNNPEWVDGPDGDHRYDSPRHYAHHPTLNMAYTSNERGGGISSWSFDPETGKLVRKQTLCTLPPDYTDEEGAAAADIKITPNGRFAYVSNRDTTKRETGNFRDTLACIALDDEGGMRIVGHSPTGHFPRSFCIDLSGRYLYAAGQRDASLSAYRIDPMTGALTRFAVYDTGNVPIWVMCGEVE